jgi:hypothetical protein
VQQRGRFALADDRLGIRDRLVRVTDRRRERPGGRHRPEPRHRERRRPVTVSAGETPPRSIRQFHEESDAVDRDSDRKIDLGIPWSNGRAKRRYTEHALLQNNTACASGTGYDPDQVSVEAPDKADAVIGSSESFGRRRLLRDKLSPLSFYVTDSPMDEAAAGHLRNGVVVVLLGLAAVGFGGLPLWVYA